MVHSRARDTLSDLTDAELAELAGTTTATADRVELIGRLHSDVAWSTHRARILARVWGIGLAHVQRLSSEASRQLTASYRGHEEEIVGRLCAAIDRAANVALNRKRYTVTADGETHEFPDPDARSVIQAQLALAQILGMVPNKHEIEIKYAKWDDDVLVQRLIEMVARSPKLWDLMVRKMREIRPEAFTIEAAGAQVVPALTGETE